MSSFKLIVLSGVVLFLTACNEVKSVEWYKEHQDEMNKLYVKCKASGEDTQTCRNVKDAHFQIQQKNAPITDFNDIKIPDLSKPQRQNN
jgi:hypothetical protein